MFKQVKNATKTNIPQRIILLCVGLALLNTPAVAARKPVSQKATTTEAQAMVSGNKESTCVGQVSSPSKLTLPVGKSTLLQLPYPVTHRTVGNANTVQAKLIAPQTLYLLGMNIGNTNMIIQDSKGSCTVVDVLVTMDPDALKQTLDKLLPEEKNIIVTAAADSLVLSGTVEDALISNRVVEIANAFVRRQQAESAKYFEKDASSGSSGGTQVSFESANNKSASSKGADSPGVINLLSVGSLQQVMLEVKIAEVSKTLLDKLGVSGKLSATNGNWVYSLLTNFLATTGAATGGAIGAVKSTNQNGFTIDAEKKDGLFKMLAEPTIMAISGQEGSFLAGGKIFIPVAQNNNTGGGTTITLEEKEFGVGLKFIPTVLAGGRINIKVAPEVSELNKEGVGISTTGFSGTAILPSFTTRRASTTVQLMDGQSFAIGGLIKNNTTANIKAFPILGEIPILGALFRSTDFQKDKTELIFVVTPHLVKPLATAYKLPTDNYTDPSRADIFLNGRMEGTKPETNAPAPAPNPPAVTKQDIPTKNEDSGFELK